MQEMNIKTKFKIGDKPYKFHDITLYQIEVKMMSIRVEENKYSVSYYDGNTWKSEDDLYESPEELCSDIKIKSI